MCKISLTQARMLRRTKIVSLVFEWLGFEAVKFYICQRKICPECSVFVSPEYVNLDEFCNRLAGQGKVDH